MVTFNAPALRRSPVPTLLLPAILGLITARFALPVVEELPLPFLWAWLGTSLVFLGILLVTMRALFPPVRWDAGARTVRIGSRTVALDSVTSATRSLSSSPTAGYLTHRYRSSEGPSFRVLVAGRPFKGLDAAGLQELGRFIAAAPIGAGSDLTPAQERALGGLQANRGAVAAGAPALLADVDELLAALGAPAAHPATAAGEAPDAASAGAAAVAAAEQRAAAERRAPGAPLVLDAAAAERLAAAWADDDADAARAIEALPAGPRLARRVLFWLLVAVIVAGAGILIAGLVIENASGGRMSDDERTAFVPWFLGALLLGLLLGLGWCLAADAHVRQLRRAGEAWWAGADAERRRRGLATPFIAAETSGARRTANFLAFAGAVVGLFGILLVIAGFAVSDIPPAVTVVSGVVGVGLSTLAIVAWRRGVRGQRRTAERIVERGGLRLEPIGLA